MSRADTLVRQPLELKSRSLRCGFLSFVSKGQSRARAPAPHSHAICLVIVRTAIDNMTRATPLMMKLIPTSVPTAHTELDGQWT